MRPVYVKWVDSVTVGEGSWVKDYDLCDEEAFCENLGWLIKENSHSVWVAGSWAPEEFGGCDADSACGNQGT